jgi:hypothetical protein
MAGRWQQWLANPRPGPPLGPGIGDVLDAGVGVLHRRSELGKPSGCSLLGLKQYAVVGGVSGSDGLYICVSLLQALVCLGSARHVASVSHRLRLLPLALGVGEKSPSSHAPKPHPTIISIRFRNSDYGHSHICRDYQTHSPKQHVKGHGVPLTQYFTRGLLCSPPSGACLINRRKPFLVPERLARPNLFGLVRTAASFFSRSKLERWTRMNIEKRICFMDPPQSC